MKTAKLIIIYLTALFLITACGGGSESLTRDEPDPSTDPVQSQQLTLRMSLVDSQDNETTLLAEGMPINANVLVTNDSGNPVPNQVVTFVLSQPGLAEFNNDTQTSLSNENGVATIRMTVGSQSGSGTLTASVENASPTIAGFQSMGTQQAIPTSLELYANAVQLASSGGDDIELIAVVKNDQNVLLPGVVVSFAADQNASLADIDPSTGSDGTARATLSTRNNKENRTITVTATSGPLIETLEIDVVGTEVNINGPSSVILNDSAPITIIVSDSDGNGIPNQDVILNTSIGQLDETLVKTGPSGQVTVSFSSNVSGRAQITANALNSTNSPYFIDVQQDDFSFVNLPTGDLDLDKTYALEITWLRDNSAFTEDGATITLSSSRGEIVDSVMQPDTDGSARFLISSEYAGPASISAVGEDSAGNQVTARAEIEFVADTVDSIFVDATPDFIGPEGQTSTITAVLRDERGNLVKDKTVNFSLTADSSGGQISPNTATTDSNGIASTVYTSNSVSGDNGVTINASADGVNGSSTLTVGDRAFDISLGTGSTIQSPDNATYLKEFAVFVTDASGRPVNDAELNASITSPAENAFYTGFWVWNDDADIYITISGGDAPTRSPGCANEDVNRDSLLDAITEDTNQDGLLTPGNVATVSFKDNISRTNEFGQATVEIRYPRQFGHWTSVTLSVFGQSAGSESSQFQVFTLPVASADISNEASPPPNSPFGTVPVCPVR